PESRPLGIGNAEVLAVSHNGQMAISLQRHPIGYFRETGILAQVPISGGAPRQLLEDVEAADWAPDGHALAIVRSIGGRSLLEYPIGKVLYKSVGWMSSPRVSPRGNAIAFIDHPFLNDDRGTITTIDLPSGKQNGVGHEWQSIQ